MYDDAELVKAARRRLRRLIEESGGGGVSNVINNHAATASSDSPNGGRTLRERMLEDAASPSERDDNDYFVKISRRDVRSPDGEVIGWDKDVHRYIEKKKKKR